MTRTPVNTSTNAPIWGAILSLIIGLVLLVATSSASAQEYKKVTRLGTSQAICADGVETTDQLQSYFANSPDVIRAILNDSGWAGSADDLFSAVAAGEFSERAFPIGTKMAWMGAKVNGQYVANPYREWAGSKSFEGFHLNVSSGCQVYEIVIPKACCNVSLLSVSPDTSVECIEPPIEPAPIAVEAVPEASFESAKTLALIPFIGAFIGTETRPRYEPSWDMDMLDSSGIVGLRAGLIKEISDRTSVFTQFSYYDRQSINSGNVYPEDNFAIDIGLERKLSEHAFIGGGIGAWNVDDSDYRDTSVFGHVGGDLGNSNFQWFLEGRLFDSDSSNHDSLSDNKMFSAGVRYLVK